MKQQDLLLLGGAALLAYFLFKDRLPDFGDLLGGGGGGGGGDIIPLPGFTPGGAGDTNGTGNGPGMPSGGGTIGNAGEAYVPVVAQSWTGVTYGQPGQPSTQFLINTLKQGGPASTAAQAGAPPRIVAKIKAGKVF